MPELDGIGFLKEYKDRSKPILVVSAIDRDDPNGPGQLALKLGAFDYVDKPSVENIERIGNEIRSKLTTGLSLKKPLLAGPHKSTPPVTKPQVTIKEKSKISISNMVNKTNLPNLSLRFKNQKTGLSKGSFSSVKTVRDSKAKLSFKSSNHLDSHSHPSKIQSSLKATDSRANQVRVLIVDDSETVRKILKSLLTQDSRFSVVGEAANPLEVESLIRTLKPDLITLDIHMPNMDGVTLLKKYLPIYQIPTVMVTSISISEGQYVLDALETGAVDYIQKPNLSDITKQKGEICERLYVASKAKVKVRKTQLISKVAKHTGRVIDHGLVAIGSSTGGTEALRCIFEQLPETIPPILVTQHIPAVFSKALAERLNGLVKFKIVEATHGQIVEANHVYIAPGGKQMGVELKNNKLMIKVTDDEPVNRHKPSVDYLFNSLAEIQHQIPQLVGVILTGMGSDGAKGLKRLRDQGAFTIGQNEATSVVYGMPKVAFEIGAVQQQLPLEKIPQGIIDALSKASIKRAS
jgi:two-component system chemotaxis response regulator CheB